MPESWSFPARRARFLVVVQDRQVDAALRAAGVLVQAQSPPRSPNRQRSDRRKARRCTGRWRRTGRPRPAVLVPELVVSAVNPGDLFEVDAVAAASSGRACHLVGGRERGGRSGQRRSRNGRARARRPRPAASSRSAKAPRARAPCSCRTRLEHAGDRVGAAGAVVAAVQDRLLLRAGSRGSNGFLGSSRPATGRASTSRRPSPARGPVDLVDAFDEELRRPRSHRRRASRS